VVDLSLAAMNQRQEMTCYGTATVLLPSREHGSVRLPHPPDAMRRQAAEATTDAARRRAVAQ